MMCSITPFKISISEERLQRLHQKLALTPFPDEISDLDSDELWSRGAPLADIKRLIAYWQDGFDWRKIEGRLNKIESVPHRATCGRISQVNVGVGIWAIWWIFMPSLDGLDVADHRVVVQAGDLGCLVARSIASKHGPNHCKDYHTNSAVPSEPTAECHPEAYAKTQATPLSDVEKAGLGQTANFFKDGNSYYQQLSTRPQTIGYSLTDSPVGLLAWLYEKLHDWTDN
ncbi:uncharacterized protein A1O9_05192 [Exophiala aquamarina CBS 119918]|uniref:Epoxide hydrolase N-terminal domain-containing protein n=1 Tax=Exophiala aquamarina CBS 119918 TaxID=1182545 RepID=A0A072PP77_9EURO|nr:uncharacterized protein A1O9_05192 [Exophiala aquamarina CBS 119918]KEF57275.1 hypothetical protein A1O9_05192 [Exophiala aquamarina CBS 119918]